MPSISTGGSVPISTGGGTLSHGDEEALATELASSTVLSLVLALNVDGRLSLIRDRRLGVGGRDFSPSSVMPGGIGEKAGGGLGS